MVGLLLLLSLKVVRREQRVTVGGGRGSCCTCGGTQVPCGSANWGRDVSGLEEAVGGARLEVVRSGMRMRIEEYFHRPVELLLQVRRVR